VTYCVDFPEPGTAVEWSLTADGATREPVDYRPRFYVTAPGDRSLSAVAGTLRDHPAVTEVARERHRPGWATRSIPNRATCPTCSSR
jgi:DNA polymerase I